MSRCDAVHASVIAFRLRTRTLFRYPGCNRINRESSLCELESDRRWRYTTRRSLITCQRRSGDREQRARVCAALCANGSGETNTFQRKQFIPTIQILNSRWLAIPKRVVEYFLELLVVSELIYFNK